jgi:thiamine pyrophosphate-dependent acetolactate synthase large subunit-like protein
LGARGVRITTPAELQRALVDAFLHDGPSVLDVVVDPEEVAPTLARRVQTLANFMSLSRSSDSRSLIGG